MITSLHYEKFCVYFYFFSKTLCLFFFNIYMTHNIFSLIYTHKFLNLSYAFDETLTLSRVDDHHTLRYSVLFSDQPMFNPLYLYNSILNVLVIYFITLCYLIPFSLYKFDYQPIITFIDIIQDISNYKPYSTSTQLYKCMMISVLKWLLQKCITISGLIMTQELRAKRCYNKESH